MTLEEQAKIFAKEKCKCNECIFCYNNSTCDEYNLYIKLYKEIAADQQKIDIDKAWKFIQKNFEITSMSNDGQMWYGVNGINKNDFLKAMEV